MIRLHSSSVRVVEQRLQTLGKNGRFEFCRPLAIDESDENRVPYVNLVLPTIGKQFHPKQCLQIDDPLPFDKQRSRGARRIDWIIGTNAFAGPDDMDPSAMAYRREYLPASSPQYSRFGLIRDRRFC